MGYLFTAIAYFIEELHFSFAKHRKGVLDKLVQHSHYQQNTAYYNISIADWQKHIQAFKDLFDQPAILKTLSKIDPKDLAITIDEHFQHLREESGVFLQIHDLYYPRELLKENLPPLAINVLGNVEQLKNNKVSIVGARKSSSQGLQMSYELGKYFSNRGYTVVSGGAFGCDIHAHLGCLDLALTPAPAIVVVPSGFAKLIPRTHLQTFQHLIKAGGTIISERLWNTTPKKYDFLRRNRLIAALGQKLIVVECTKYSGAMSTANMALNIGIDVLTSAKQLKHGDVRASGNAHLIENGASFFYDAEEAYDLLLQDS